MRKLFCISLALGLFFGISANSIAGECESANNEIPLSQIESIFQKMETQSKWNTKAKLLWGYFFFDADKAKLQKLSTQLANEGYAIRIISMLAAGTNEAEIANYLATTGSSISGNPSLPQSVISVAHKLALFSEAVQAIKPLTHPSSGTR